MGFLFIDSQYGVAVTHLSGILCLIHCGLCLLDFFSHYIKIVLVPSFYLINIALKVIGLHGGALLGVAYRTSRRISPMAATAISTQSMPLSGFGNSGVTSSFAAPDDPFSSNKPAAEVAPQNFQLYRFLKFSCINIPELLVFCFQQF